MSSRRTAASEAALIPLFVGQRGCSVSFVVDTSEDMRAVLGSVKHLLIQALLTKASLRDSLFNIMTFSGEVTCWSHHMLPCAPHTVYMALSWIHSISCSPGRDLLAALTTAFADPACHTVHLLCTDLPNHPEAVLTALPALTAGRPVNVFYLQDSGVQLDCSVRDYLQCLSQATRGSCYVIPVGSDGVLKKVIPLCVEENPSSALTDSWLRCCCRSGSVPPMSSPPPRCSLGHPPHPVFSCMLSSQTLSPEFRPGSRVLARTKGGGLYYSGTVIQQVQGRGGVWVVEFDHPEASGSGAVCLHRQLVYSLDMVNPTQAPSHYPAPGDTVLSPWEPDQRRFGPGRVMGAATECRDGYGAPSLRVLMWNRCVSLVPVSLVSPISESHHDRIVRELQITASASRPCWPRLGACSSSCTPRLFSAHRCCPQSLQPRCRSSCGGTHGSGRTQNNTDVWVNEPEVASSSSSSSLPEEEPKSPPAVKLRSKEQRPPWRYWRRTGPEPQHRQPGSAALRTSCSVRFSLPAPQISVSPNHGSLFQSLPGAKGRRATIRDVFRTTDFKEPRPPVGLQPGNRASVVYT